LTSYFLLPASPGTFTQGAASVMWLFTSSAFAFRLPWLKSQERPLIPCSWRWITSLCASFPYIKLGDDNSFLIRLMWKELCKELR
jgi:hypothetical protein